MARKFLLGRDFLHRFALTPHPTDAFSEYCSWVDRSGRGDFSRSESTVLGSTTMLTNDAFDQQDCLVLGYKTSLKNGQLTAPVCSGEQPERLFLVHKKNTARHTVVVAQSGSGKSYFLGTYVEELLLRTAVNIVVLDPNADFRFFHKPRVFSNGDSLAFSHKLPERQPYDEDAQAFSDRWQSLNETIRVEGRKDEGWKASQILDAKFEWRDFPLDLILEGCTQEQVEHLIFIHHFVIQCLVELAVRKKYPTDTEVVDLVQRAFHETEGTNPDPEAAAKAFVGHALSELNGDPTLVESIKQPLRSLRGCQAGKNVYISIYQRFSKRNLISHVPHPSARMRIVDLPSIDDLETRDAIVLLTLNEVWRDAAQRWKKAADRRGQEMQGQAPTGTSIYTRDVDNRVPQFIIIDEAHNFIPSESPVGYKRKLIREALVRIAAEGRKYGLFLVLVTQRPDKLDPRVLSECTNHAIMKTNSPVAIQACEKMLGIELPEMDKYIIMHMMTPGTARISGVWANGVSDSGSRDTQFVSSCGRRTHEGGVDLSDSWFRASTLDSPPKPTGTHVDVKTPRRKRISRSSRR